MFESIPNEKVIINNLRKLTDLNLEIEEDPVNNFCIFYEGIDKADFFLDKERNYVKVLSSSVFQTYIFFSLIHVLEDLGGELLVRKYLPKWKGKKWEDKNWWDFTMLL